MEPTAGTRPDQFSAIGADVLQFVTWAEYAVAALVSVAILCFLWNGIAIARATLELSRLRLEEQPFPQINDDWNPTPGKSIRINLRLALLLRNQLLGPGARVSLQEIIASGATELYARILPARRIIRVLVFVAIAGTLAGLVSGIHGLEGVHTPKAPKDVFNFLDNMLFVLSQFGKAFMATLYGVGGTLILAVGDYLYSAIVQKYLRTYERFVTEHLEVVLLGRYQITTSETLHQRANDILLAISNDLPEATREFLSTADEIKELIIQAHRAAEAVNTTNQAMQQLPARLDQHLSVLTNTHTQLLSAQQAYLRETQSSNRASNELLSTMGDISTNLSQTNNLLRAFIATQQARNSDQPPASSERRGFWANLFGGS